MHISSSFNWQNGFDRHFENRLGDYRVIITSTATNQRGEFSIITHVIILMNNIVIYPIFRLNNIVQYCWQVWTTWAAKHCSVLLSSGLGVFCRVIENVQRRATVNLYWIILRMCHIPRDLSEPIFFPLNFAEKLTLLFKSRAGLIFTDVNDFLCTFEPRYRSRNYDINNYNLIIKHKQDYYRKSFFIRSAELWNSLPSYLKVYHSLPAFKSTLYN
jgi:hypothetical protein